MNLSELNNRIKCIELIICKVNVTCNDSSMQIFEEKKIVHLIEIHRNKKKMNKMLATQLIQTMCALCASKFARVKKNKQQTYKYIYNMTTK